MPLIVGLFLVPLLMAAPAVTILTDAAPAPRVRFGVERLAAALKEAGYSPRVVNVPHPVPRGETILVGLAHKDQAVPGPQGFALLSTGPHATTIAGADDSGMLYGALELADRIRSAKAIPRGLDVRDAPKFVLRGPCIGMQKTEITYDGAPYDYRYTPQDFPFFYDQQQWTRYLDFLLDNRMNTLYLWNGHPFTSLLKLPKYPEAQELSDEQLARNIEVFKWLTAEADKRGIWVIQFFYNIHLSHAFARAHNVPFQHSAPSELTSQYTRYSISEFIRNYPNVGLLMTLGEALSPRFGPEWLANTIIPGVKDGMRALGTDKEPPIIVRAHATDIERAIPLARQSYQNIYTMHKYNGESLTWTDVRGEVARLHTKLVELGSAHIVNVHLLANLEPFRWGSPEFIQKCMQSCRRIGIKGLHLYPLRYWEWPISADNATPPLLQIDRDWIWFEAWARYAWNPDRDPAAERQYWIGRIALKYGSRQAAERILDAYQLAGVCAPRLLPRVGITEGNRQAFALGMLMTQLIDPDRYNPMTLLWTGDAPPGERLQQWVEKEWEKKPHEGETPPGVADEVVESATRAVAAAEAAQPLVTRDREEFQRFLNDLHCIQTLMMYYRAKTRAAALVLRYGYSHEIGDLNAALRLLEESVGEYTKLVSLTDKTYRQACSVHTTTRRIPFLGRPGRYTHWRDCLPEYEKELANFRRNLASLALNQAAPGSPKERAALPAVPVKLLSKDAEVFQVQPGEKLYTDLDVKVAGVAPELRGLTGIRLSNRAAVDQGVRLEFETAEPVQVLVGLFRGRTGRRRDAAQAPADEWEPVLRDAVVVPGRPWLTVWTHKLPAGRNELDLGKGAYVILGFVKRDAELEPRLVFRSGDQGRADLDWLFE